MSRLIRFFLLFSITALFSFPFQSSYATHTMGADITYTCTGGNQYEVKLTLFRDCAGITPLTTQNLTYSSVSCGVSSGSIPLIQSGSTVDVTPLCPTGISACVGGAGASIFGIQQYTYTGTLNLPAIPCTDWELGWSNCCRNNAITTLNTPGNQSTYISALLDNTVNPCNNSPVFNHIPTPIVCINQSVIYNHGVTDPDGDSLVFSLADCFQDPSIPVVYAAGFSNTVPLATSGGVSIDATTGELLFTPNQVQIGVICVKVEEYRAGVKIGETVRDMQFSVINCSNSPPTASGINGNATDYDMDICIGGNVCFDILIGDVDLDNVTAVWNNGIPGGILTINNNGTTAPTATFCWQPTTSDIGSHFFTITVEDDNCPLSGSATYAFTVNVAAGGNSIFVPNVSPICSGASATIAANAPGASSFSWSPTTGLTTPNNFFTSASPSVTTVYTVTASFPGGCSLSETVTVNVNQPPSVSVTPPVSFVCSGSPVTLTTTSSGATSFSWSPGGSTGPSLTASPTSTTTYTVTADDGNGCTSSSSATVNVSTPGSNSCDVIYVSSSGSGAGTAASPTDLLTALSMAACNNVVIKMDIGTYNIDNAISTLFDNITLEGGFEQSLGWRKTSSPGATTIHRSALNPAGPANSQRLVAFELIAASNFRFQDLTITTADAVTPGTSTYGIHLSNCSNYTFARCQIFPGNASAGADGADGGDGLDGDPGLNGDAGSDFDQDAPGEGGAGGNGAGTMGGIGGAGGLDTQNGATCCTDAGFGSSSCCLPGSVGTSGNDSGSLRDGGGGGGGGCGGEASESGGNAGGGGGINSGANQMGGGIGGVGGNPATSTDGTDGFNGLSGAAGTNGGSGLNGSHTGGFWLSGAQAPNGDNGQGGKGGVGGGGGGGEGCGLCDDGAGSGGGGGGGGGQGGEGGQGGYGGGSSYAVYLYQNGTGGLFLSSNISAGTAGAGGIGGSGGNGGSGGIGGNGNAYTGTGSSVGAGGDGGDGGSGGIGGIGGNGMPGETMNLYNHPGGNALSTNQSSSNLSALPVITMDNVSCTGIDIFFSAPTSNIWDLGSGSTFQNPTGMTVDCQYTTIGRRDIDFAGNTYPGFANIIVNNTAIVPNFATSAPMISGQYTICAGTAVDFSALNGGAGYVYNWDLGGGAIPNTYSGTTHEILNAVTFNTPGTYTIELRYNSDCCGLTSPVTIDLIVEEQPFLSISGPNIFCAGDGGVTVSASGGTTYQWSPSTGLSASTGSSVLANPTSSTTYAVSTYSSGGNCFASTTVPVTVNDIALSASSTDAGCLDDGTASVIASLGSGSYTYDWGSAGTGPSVTGLASGTYSVLVTDAVTGCTETANVVVNQAANTLDSYISSTVSVSCNGMSDGTATVTPTGIPSGTLIYNWSPAGGASPTSSPLAAGTYTVNITDLGNGCQTSSSVTIPEPDPIAINVLSAVDPDCSTFGQIVANASGGNGPYTYSWNTTPVQTGNTATNLTPGSYTVTVLDKDNCSNTLSITAPGTQSPVSLSLNSVIDASLCTASDGSINVSATGSGGSINYSWSPPTGTSTGTATGLMPGSYTVTAIGSNGCTDIMGITLGPACPLPVDYLYFSATAETDHIALAWETLLEEENTGFFLERRIQTSEFADIAWIPSLSIDGEGNSYLFPDTDVIPEQSYWYRLRQVDLNGAIAFSQVQEARLGEQNPDEAIRIYPIPTKDVVYIEVYSEDHSQMNFRLFNQLGQQVKTKSFDLSEGVTNLTVDMKSFASGVYLARMNIPNRKTKEVRLIKIK